MGESAKLGRIHLGWAWEGGVLGLYLYLSLYDYMIIYTYVCGLQGYIKSNHACSPTYLFDAKSRHFRIGYSHRQLSTKVLSLAYFR